MNSKQYGDLKIGMRVHDAVYGYGTVKRFTVRPDRAWVKWEETAFTTPINASRLTPADIL